MLEGSDGAKGIEASKAAKEARGDTRKEQP